MSRSGRQMLAGTVAAGLAALLWAGSGTAEESYQATITYFGGQTTSVRDLRTVYSWREMAADAQGLTPYQDRTQVERGLWVINVSLSQPSFERISFPDLQAIEFETDIQQIGVSPLYQFRVRRVLLLRKDGARVDCSSSLVTQGTPVFWPEFAALRFPQEDQGKRIESRQVSLQAITKIEGRDSEFVFVFPAPLHEGIESVLRKKRASFPRLIEFVSPAR